MGEFHQEKKIRGIKARFQRMPLPPPNRFSSTERFEGNDYGAEYRATVGDFHTEHRLEAKLGLVWTIDIYGTQEACDRTLADFVSELGEPVSKLILGATSEDPLVQAMYFWKAEPLLH